MLVFGHVFWCFSRHTSLVTCHFLQPNREIERKFLVREMPADLASLPHAEISQGYLVSLDDGLQVRLRKTGERYSLTYKRGRGNVREEREVELTAEQFDGALAGDGRQAALQDTL